MRCDQAQSSIDAYLDSALPERERSALEQHLLSCAECETVRGQARRLRTLLGAMPSRTVSDRFDQELMAAARKLPAPQPGTAWMQRFRLRWEWRLRMPALCAAGSLAMALVAVVVAPNITSWGSEREARRREFVSSAVNRHLELKESSTVDWDAVDSSIELSTGDVLSEGRLTP